MTNEQIEKRFKFELEMGIFKQGLVKFKGLPLNEYRRCIFNSINKDDIYKLYHILHNIGFKNKYNNTYYEEICKLDTLNQFSIVIFTDSNKYCFGESFSSFGIPIPNYILDYKLY